MELEAEPEAIFFQKFENANEQTRAQYKKLAIAETHVLVVAVKSSGSLFLVTARAGVMVVASKNGMGNVYADCGHLVLIRHLQEAHGADFTADGCLHEVAAGLVHPMCHRLPGMPPFGGP